MPTPPKSDVLPPMISSGTDDTNAVPGYKLQFGDADMVSASSIAIKGHFWYELDAVQD